MPPTPPPYIRELRATSDPRVVFTGYLFGEGYRELASNAYCFVETSEVGGTHPALLEAMAFGRCVVVNDTPENLETVGEAGFSYDGAMGARELADGPGAPARGSRRWCGSTRRRAQERVREHYSWESVTDAYERLFRELLGEAR